VFDLNCDCFKKLKAINERLLAVEDCQLEFSGQLSNIKAIYNKLNASKAVQHREAKKLAPEEELAIMLKNFKSVDVTDYLNGSQPSPNRSIKADGIASDIEDKF